MQWVAKKEKVVEIVRIHKHEKKGKMTQATCKFGQSCECLLILTETSVIWICEFLFVNRIWISIVLNFPSNLLSCEDLIEAASALCFVLVIAMRLYFCPRGNCCYSTSSLNCLCWHEAHCRNKAIGSRHVAENSPMERSISVCMKKWLMKSRMPWKVEM